MSDHPWFFVTFEQYAAIPIHIPEISSKAPPLPYKTVERLGRYMLGFGMRDEPVRLAVIAKTTEERVAQMVEAGRPCISCRERPPVSETVAEAKRPDGTTGPAVFYLCAECDNQPNKTHLKNGAAHARRAPEPKQIRPRQSSNSQTKRKRPQR